MDTIFFFEFEVFGKTFKASIRAQNEELAKDILFQKIQEKVKIKSVAAHAPENILKQEIGFIEKMFNGLGLNVKRK